jgi:hypothetical protein
MIEGRYTYEVTIIGTASWICLPLTMIITQCEALERLSSSLRVILIFEVYGAILNIMSIEIVVE